jgi:hypothetical protein
MFCRARFRPGVTLLRFASRFRTEVFFSLGLKGVTKYVLYVLRI